MNDYKKKFDKRKESIMKLLEEAEKFYGDILEDNENVRTFKSLANSLQNDEFSIVVVGEFSSGKSTFLNALMQERILPSFTNETTATVNFLKHKDKALSGEAGIVYYSNNTTKSLPKVDIATIESYVSTSSSDVDVAKDIEHLDLFLDSKFLKEGVTLVDSPGLNGLADRHREITERQIECSSASIFMFRADQPGSKSDFEFLRDLKNKVNTIIFVLNKIDNIKSSEGETVESVIDKLKENYKNQFPEDKTMPEIWGVSAYQALVARSKESLEYRGTTEHTQEQKEKWLKESRIEKFEDRLWKFLTMGEKAQKMLSEPIDRTINLLGSTKKSMEEEKNILENKTDTQEIKDQIEKIKKEEENIEIKTKADKGEIENALNVKMRDANESIASEMQKYLDETYKRIDEWETVNDYDEYTLGFNNKTEKKVKKIISNIGEEYEETIHDIINSKYAEIASQINMSIDFSISLPEKYEVKESAFSKDIDKYDKEIEVIKKELEEAQSKIDDLDIEASKRRRVESERDRIQAKLERKESEKSVYERTFTPPQRRTFEVTDVSYEGRDGVLGIFFELLIGRKQVTKPRVMDNQDEIDSYRADFERGRKELANEKELLQKQLDEYKNTGMSLEEIEKKRQQADRKLAQLEEEKKTRAKQFKEEFLSNQKSFLKKQKNDLEDYISELSDYVQKEFKKYIKAIKTQYVDAICTAISSSLKESLESKRKEREDWEKKLESSEQDKNIRIQTIDSQLKKLVEIMNMAAEVSAENVEKTDSVQQNIEGEL